MEKIKTNTAIRQTVDYYFIKNFCNTRVTNRQQLVFQVLQDIYRVHKIEIEDSYVRNRIKSIFAGDTLRPCADVNGTPSNREGKNLNYAGFCAIMDAFLPNLQKRFYIGLPANQLDSITEIARGHITSVEWQKTRAVEFSRLRALIITRRPKFKKKIDVIHGDLWKFLRTKSNAYNVFDLDLMCALPKDTKEWAKLLYQSSKDGVSVIHLTTIIGRVITVDSYEKRIVWFNRNLVSAGFKPVGGSRFRYRDRSIPMRCERIVVRKGGK